LTAQLNAAVARAVVHNHKQHLGRGPSKVHAFFRGNVVVVVLEDTMTPAERSLSNDGKGATVLGFRAELESTMRTDIVAAVELLTDRQVVAFMSASHLDPDMAAEIFVLDRPLAVDELNQAPSE
jgi:uncharacterized protein YbcI